MRHFVHTPPMKGRSIGAMKAPRPCWVANQPTARGMRRLVLDVVLRVLSAARWSVSLPPCQPSSVSPIHSRHFFYLLFAFLHDILSSVQLMQRKHLSARVHRNEFFPTYLRSSIRSDVSLVVFYWHSSPKRGSQRMWHLHFISIRNNEYLLFG